MRKCLFVLVLASCCWSSALAQVSFGESSLFNEDWLFVLDDKEEYYKPDIDDSRWRRLSLPHDYSVEGTLSPSLASATGYLPGGIAWYRKHFVLPESASESLFFIYFEGIYNRSEVYLNGHLLGKRPNGYVSFMYEMTPYLNKTGDNVIAVRVDHSRYADSRWYTGSGIYRDVWMIKSNETHLSQWGNTYRLIKSSRRTAKVEVAGDVCKKDNNHQKLTVQIDILDADKRVVAKVRKDLGKESAYSAVMNISNPQLWDIHSPYLYTIQTRLLQNGNEIDRCETKAGLRTLTFDPNKGFALNNKWMKVKGVCLHHDAGVLGSVVPKVVWKRRLERLKEIGVNAIRMSHNPQSPDLYDLCDEMGFLVMDEASDEWEHAKRKWIKGWNRGEPGYDGSYDFFEEWIDNDVRDMVRRDRNHPSIFLWSIGNEVDYPNDPYSHPVLDGSSISQPMYGGYKPSQPDAMRLGVIARRLASVVREADRSRPVTGALAGVVMSNETGYPEALDVVGYNYTEDRYKSDHEKYPKRVIYGSENRHDIDAWRAVSDNDFIFGQFLWTGIDYLGESGAWPSRGSTAGLLDLAGNIKPRGWFRASLWSDKPVCYIGTYPIGGFSRRGNRVSTDAPDLWNYREGQKIRVVCYTNAEKALLFLNNVEVGEMKSRDEKTGTIYWDIDYKDGELRAESYSKEGTVVAQYAIRTSGRPYALKVTSDKEKLNADGDVAHLLIEVTDENGQLVRLADNNVYCTTSNNIRLLGLESGNVQDMTNYRDNNQRVYQGRLLAYIKTNGAKGNAVLRFTSPLLEGCEITIPVE